MKTIEVFYKEPVQEGDIISTTFEKCSCGVGNSLEYEKFIRIAQDGKITYIAVDRIASIIVTENKEV